MHTAHLFVSWHPTSPTQHTNFCPLYAYSQTACIPSSAFSHSPREILSRCVSCHFAGILTPAFFHSTYQLRFYAHCRPPICFHSHTIVYPARVQRYSHITPCGSLNSSVNASFLCTLNQTLYLIWNLVCITPSLYVPLLCITLSYIPVLRHALFTYIPLSVPHSLLHTGLQTHRLSVTYITTRISSILASTTLLFPCLTWWTRPLLHSASSCLHHLL